MHDRKNGIAKSRIQNQTVSPKPGRKKPPNASTDKRQGQKAHSIQLATAMEQKGRSVSQ